MDNTNRFAKIIRVVTVAPIMALGLLTILYGLRPDIFQGRFFYILSIVFLTVLPVLAYPLQPFVPGFRNKGRDGQRNLAIVMAVLGYLGSIVSALRFQAPKTVWLIFLTYFISGMGILLFNKVLQIRASGHVCGVAGPISFLVYLFGVKALFGVVVLMLVYWSSLKMKRHTVSQLLWGSVIPIFSLLIAVCTV